MDAKVTWKQKMSFDGSADTNFIVPLGTSPEVGGDNDGFKPMELFLVGLAGCTAMDVISILQKKQQKVESFEVQVHADRTSEHPKVFTQMKIIYLLSGTEISRDAVQRAVDLSTQKYCPAQAMFSKLLPIEQEIIINEI
jgi:putative redox protein